MLAEEGRIRSWAGVRGTISNVNFVYYCMQEPASRVSLTGVRYANACDSNRLRSTKNCVTIELR